MFISFISPGYNVKNYLDDFFTSFKKLPKDKFEVIFIDDKSPDKGYEVAEKYKKDFNLKVIKNKENKGLGFSRNVGLENISNKTTHVIYIDTDDMFDDVKVLDEIIKDEITIFEFKSFNKVKEWDEKYNHLFLKNLFRNSVCAIAIPRELALKHKFTARLHEDIFPQRSILTEGKEKGIVHLSDTSCLKSRKRASSITGSRTNSEEFKWFIDQFTRLRDNGLTTKRFAEQEIYQYYWMWKKHLKELSVKKDLPKISIKARVWYWFTGNAIRFLKLEGLIYGKGDKDAFE